MSLTGRPATSLVPLLLVTIVLCVLAAADEPLASTITTTANRTTLSGGGGGVDANASASAEVNKPLSNAVAAAAMTTAATDAAAAGAHQVRVDASTANVAGNVSISRNDNGSTVNSGECRLALCVRGIRSTIPLFKSSVAIHFCRIA